MNVGKCIIQPLYFRERNEREQKEYDEQMKNISALYEDEAEFLPEGVQCMKVLDAARRSAKTGTWEKVY